jgi:hypothetical protein
LLALLIVLLAARLMWIAWIYVWPWLHHLWIGWKNSWPWLHQHWH